MLFALIWFVLFDFLQRWTVTHREPGIFKEGMEKKEKETDNCISTMPNLRANRIHVYFPLRLSHGRILPRDGQRP